MDKKFIAAYVGKCLEFHEKKGHDYITEQNIINYMNFQPEIDKVDEEEVNETLGLLLEARFLVGYGTKIGMKYTRYVPDYIMENKKCQHKPINAKNASMNSKL